MPIYPHHPYRSKPTVLPRPSLSNTACPTCSGGVSWGHKLQVSIEVSADPAGRTTLIRWYIPIHESILNASKDLRGREIKFQDPFGGFRKRGVPHVPLDARPGLPKDHLLQPLDPAEARVIPSVLPTYARFDVA